MGRYPSGARRKYSLSDRRANQSFSKSLVRSQALTHTRYSLSSDRVLGNTPVSDGWSSDRFSDDRLMGCSFPSDWLLAAYDGRMNWLVKIANDLHAFAISLSSGFDGYAIMSMPERLDKPLEVLFVLATIIARATDNFQIL